MKIKFTLIVTKCIKELHFTNPRYFQIYLTDCEEFPQAYMSTKCETETLKSLFDKHFHLDFGWAVTELAGFRRINQNEAEVVYTFYMPEVLGAEKNGHFVTQSKLKTIGIEEYYEQLLSRRSRSY